MPMEDGEDYHALQTQQEAAWPHVLTCRAMSSTLFRGVALGGVLLLTTAGLVPRALAAPITVSASGAAAQARSDVGGGVCGTAVLFKTQATPLAQLSDAMALLNKAPNDANILDRRSRIFGNLNFRNSDLLAIGDFTAPDAADALFPYSNSASADPPGIDTNIALRLRGYLNIKDNLSGSPMTFGLNCDDACSLTIATQAIIPLADVRISTRFTKQVIFQAPGLYPLEIVYFQNASAAFLEWSRALSAEPEGSQINSLDVSTFQIVPPTDLFAAITDTNVACQECGAPGMTCATGSYCGDGLCQRCTLPDHCGPSCITCPAEARLCRAGQCVECASSADCGVGRLCDTATGQCKHSVDAMNGGSVSVGCQCQTGGAQNSGSSAWLVLAVVGAVCVSSWLRRRPSHPRAS